MFGEGDVSLVDVGGDWLCFLSRLTGESYPDRGLPFLSSVTSPDWCVSLQELTPAYLAQSRDIGVAVSWGVPSPLRRETGDEHSRFVGACREDSLQRRGKGHTHRLTDMQRRWAKRGREGDAASSGANVSRRWGIVCSFNDP